jgi:hypothetical protein
MRPRPTSEHKRHQHAHRQQHLVSSWLILNWTDENIPPKSKNGNNKKQADHWTRESGNRPAPRVRADWGSNRTENRVKAI